MFPPTGGVNDEVPTVVNERTVGVVNPATVRLRVLPMQIGAVFPAIGVMLNVAVPPDVLTTMVVIDVTPDGEVTVTEVAVEAVTEAAVPFIVTEVMISEPANPLK
jgi:hypothetical protein